MSKSLIATALIRRSEVPNLDVSHRLLAAAEARGFDLNAANEYDADVKARAILALHQEHLTTAPAFTPAERLEVFEYLATNGHREAASRLAGQAPGSIDLARQARSDQHRAAEDTRYKASSYAFRLDQELGAVRERRQVAESKVAELARSTMPPALIREAVEYAANTLDTLKAQEQVLSHDAMRARAQLDALNKG